MFKHALVKRPGKSMVDGITTAGLGQPDYELALRQHDRYIETLQSCGVEVIILEADEQYPDSVFIEDTAVLTEKCAVLTNPGAPPRQGEEKSVKKALEKYYTNIESIKPPGTLEGGDIMKAGNHFYIGISARTNEAGVAQLAKILKKYGYTSTNIPLKNVLHLKTGLAYLENNNLLAAGEFIHHPAFAKFNKIIIAEKESYSANCIWINGTVLVPLGFPVTKKSIRATGYRILEVDVSEFRKLDGGLSCLSLRF